MSGLVDGRPRRVTRRGLTTALGVQLLVRGFGVASGVVVAAALARGLGHTGFGQFSLALSLAAIATALADLGITSAAVRQLALDPTAAATTAGALVLARTVTGIFGAGFVVVAAYLADPSHQVLPVAIVVAATLLLSPLVALQPVGQATLRVGAINLLLLLQSVLWTVAVLTLAASRAHILSYAAAFLLVALVQTTTNWLTFKARTPVSLSGAKAQLRKLVGVAWPVGVGGLFVTAYYRMDSLILFHFHGPASTADFSAAYRFLDVLQVIPATLLSVVLPLLASTWRTPTREALHRRQRLFALALTVVVGASLPISVGGALVARPLISFVYGEGFDGAAPLLAVLIASFPAISIGYVSVGLALASGRTRLYASVAAIAGVGNVAANLWLVPSHGAAAAAWLTVGTEYGVAAALLALLGSRSGTALPWARWLRALAATACLAAVVIPLREASLFYSVGAGGLVFLASAAGLRVLTGSDIRAIMSRERLESL